ncbi:MAG TPA: hypothetical protein VD978_33630 [Azospirillum sp.]|nr:hypothetical protein [Azospirillum sp.]
MSALNYVPPRSIIDEIWDTEALTTFDPLADGLLMSHQRAWVADESELKIAEKGRRTGITWAEAYSSVMTASAARSAGGDDVWYIGDTKDKGREFINTCRGFAEKIAGELVEVEEFLFDDVEVDAAGNVTTKQISAWRITFASGFRISALSSNPANIRGLQGVVIIDEAGFHKDVAKVLDACLALLIWGGKIRIISTHNGKANPFNTLIKEVREGTRIGRVHTIPFDQAVADGLYERVCAVRGWKMSPEGKAAWYNKVRKSYGSRTDAMREELDAIPREGEGTMIPLALIEAAQTDKYPLVRWTKPDARAGKDFVDWTEFDRREHMRQWLAEYVTPLLEALPANADCAVGEDFAMRQDRTDIAVGFTDERLVRHAAFLVELRECPYDQQKQALFHICDFLRGKRRFSRGVLDANGNGMVLAQEARQRYGEDRILELMPQDKWLLREITPLFAAAFVDRTILIPLHKDVRDDVHQFRLVNGVGKIPTDVRTEGTDGGRRHADAAVAILNFYAATFGAVVEYGYEAAHPHTTDNPHTAPDDDDDVGFGAGAY